MNTHITHITVRTLTALAIILTLFACQDVLEDVELGETRDLLVVEGAVQTHTDTQFVKLSRTADYFSEELPDYSAESNAEIVLFEDGNSVGTMTFNAQSEQFELVFEPSLWSEYHIEISLSNGEEYVSSPEELRNAGNIDSLYYEYQSEEEAFFQAQYQFFINAQELEGPGDSYQWKVYINGEYQSRPQDLSFVTDEFVDGNYIQRADIFNISEDRMDEFFGNSDSVTVKVEHSGITRDFYRYLFRLQDQSFSGSPFDTPPAEIQSNVAKREDSSERALGYFYAADVYEAPTLTVRRRGSGGV